MPSMCETFLSSVSPVSESFHLTETDSSATAIGSWADLSKPLHF